MSERDPEPQEPAGRPVQDGTAADAPTRRMPGGQESWREQTTPGMTPIRGGAAAEPGPGYGEPGYNPQGYAPGYGTQGYGAQQYGAPGSAGQYAGPGAGTGYADETRGWGAPGGATEPEYSSRPVVLRRPDALAGLLCVLAGIAAGVSLLLHWVRDNSSTGWDIVHSGIDVGRSSVRQLFDQGYWQPMAVIAAGALLFLIGLLLFLPARTHRFLGVLALLVSLGAAAAVLTAMSLDHWKVSIYDLGMWFAVAVAALGLLGALKAMLTGPKLGTQPPRA